MKRDVKLCLNIYNWSTVLTGQFITQGPFNIYVNYLKLNGETWHFNVEAIILFQIECTEAATLKTNLCKCPNSQTGYSVT